MADYSNLRATNGISSSTVEQVKQLIDETCEEFRKILEVVPIGTQLSISEDDIKYSCDVDNIGSGYQNYFLFSDLVIFPTFDSTLATNVLAAAGMCMYLTGSIRPIFGVLLINPNLSFSKRNTNLYILENDLGKLFFRIFQKKQYEIIVNDLNNPGKYKHIKESNLCSAAKGFYIVDPSGYLKVCNHSPTRICRYDKLETLKNLFRNDFIEITEYVLSISLIDVRHHILNLFITILNNFFETFISYYHGNNFNNSRLKNIMCFIGDNPLPKDTKINLEENKDDNYISKNNLKENDSFNINAHIFIKKRSFSLKKRKKQINKNSKYADVDIQKIEKYIELEILKGIVKLPSFKDYWNKDDLLINSISSIMTESKYCSMNECIHHIFY